MKEYQRESQKHNRTIQCSSNPCLQRLSKQQRDYIKSYKLTSAFKEKHICKDASRANVTNKAFERGIPRSTLIRISDTEVEQKALSICKSGDDNQVAAEKKRNYGVQLYVRLTNIPIASYNNGTGNYERNDTGKFIVVGKWGRDYCEGNHYEGNYNKLPNNDTDLFPNR